MPWQLPAILVLALVVGGSPARAPAAEPAQPAPAQTPPPLVPTPPPVADDGGAHHLLHALVWYLPNRVFDLLDPVRARVRVGPGMAGGVRATELADLYLGAYMSVYAGLPGPRGRRLPRLPAGLEARSGVEVSAADLSSGAGLGPDYSATEFGLGGHVALVGIDVGVDPVEIADLVLGFIGIDLRDDDF